MKEIDMIDYAATSTRLEIRGRDVQEFVLPSWGFLELVEIRPAAGLLANMDASVPYRLHVALLDPDGKPIPVNATLVARDVKELTT